MASGTISLRQREVGKVEAVTDFVLLGSKITVEAKVEGEGRVGGGCRVRHNLATERQQQRHCNLYRLNKCYTAAHITVSTSSKHLKIQI